MSDTSRDEATLDSTAESAGSPPLPPDEARRPMNRHLQRVLDHLWGPTGSVVLHILLVLLLVRFVTGMQERRQTDIEVMVVKAETRDLEELQKELEKIKDVEVEIRAPDADIVMDQPPDVQPVQANPMEDFASLDIKADVQSPLILKGLFAGRTAAGRAALGARFGGKTFGATEAAVLKALEWLKNHQLEDGSWEGEGRAKCKTAMTGLALLAFLAHGETPTSERYGPTVERAIRFLVEQDWQGNRFRYVDGGWYGHGIASYALAEAYALTRIPSVKVVAEQAIRRIVEGQQDTGAFNYGINPSHTRRDSSVMGWMNQAMKAAYIGGLEVPGLKEAMEKGVNGYKLNFDPNRRMFAYAPDGPGAAVTGGLSTTCFAVLCLQLLGHGADPEAKAGFDSMRGMSADYSNPPGRGHALYIWYYATQAHFHTGGKDWTDWNNVFAPSFVRAQNADGSWFAPEGTTERAYGPVYATSFVALTLMVYYRFLPTYQQIQIEETPAEKPPEDEVSIQVTSADRLAPTGVLEWGWREAPRL